MLFYFVRPSYKCINAYKSVNIFASFSLSAYFNIFVCNACLLFFLCIAIIYRMPLVSMLCPLVIDI